MTDERPGTAEEIPEGERPTYNGRYEVQRRIARGGMADVFLARDLLLARPVAVKVLFPEFASDPAFVARFRREAQAAANLNHPNIVGVYDWGQEGGTYYIVMEYIDGRSLSEILRTQGTPPAKTAAGIAADVAAALGFAHRNGVVHRDIKPGNIMITNGGHVKVADFGIARAITASAEDNLTRTGSVMGTATYFSPEQAQGHNVEGRSDLYSLGVVMYEMAHGRPPFVADSPIAVAYKHVQEAPEPLRPAHPEVPEGYEAITMRLLAKDPADRYPDADALRADLRRFAEGRHITAPAAAASSAANVPPSVPTGPVPATVPGPHPAPQHTHHSRTGWFVLLLVVLLVLLGGSLYALASTLGVFEDDTTVEVPDVTGQSAEAARLILIDRGDFTVDMTARQTSETVEEGKVISQDPPPGTEADRGSTVRLVISSGKPPPPVKEVPDVVGLSADEADRRLRDAGFEVRRREQESDEVDEGDVISQSPTAGSDHEEGAIVEITVSLGPPPETEPPPTEPPPTEPPPTEPPPTEPPTESTEPPTSGTTPPSSSSPSSSTPG